MVPCNYWVFRDGRSAVEGEFLRDGLVKALRDLRIPNSSRPSAGVGSSDSLLDALLRSGELETALTDAGADDVAAAAVITNALAAALLHFWTGDVGLDTLALAASQLRVPESLNVSTPEGFAYYALHPLAFAKLTDSLDFTGRRVAVIGIRSIGTTLGAVVATALARRNVPAQRISVRPIGHPYDRKTQFTSPQMRWIAAHRAEDAEFLVVDEGPGLSGSSFLSVGDALLEAGVERRRIRFLCSREPDPDTLAAPQAGERWRSIQVHHVSENIAGLPADAQVYCGGGEWRRWFYEDADDWPATWTHMERLKFFSPDRRRLFKFTGYGRFGVAVHERARILETSGFGPPVLHCATGFAEYEYVAGRPAKKADLSRTVIERIADYCAMRRVEFAVRRPLSRLEEMTRFNFQQLTGTEPPEWVRLEQPAPVVICDARMQPHEWMVPEMQSVDRGWHGGDCLKTDATSHGDDHFFPGPCDNAWDLAGAIVEWEMNDDASEALLRRYEQRSGDNARRRLPAYVVAYSVFRAAYTSMAAFALRGDPEEKRLARAAQWYVAAVNRAVRKPSHHDVPVAPVPSEFSGSLCLEPGT